MSEEEIIKEVESAIWFMKEDNYNVNTFVKAIQGLLDLYNKEKETSHYIQSQLDIANAKLIEEKEKNKELYEDNQKQWEERCRLTFEFDNYTSKDKIRKIIYPTPTNPISYEIQTSDMYKKILELLGEE